MAMSSSGILIVAELQIVETLRSMRMVHHAGWLASRWEDPAFPTAFPWFNTERYWEQQIADLYDQLALMEEDPLVVVTLIRKIGCPHMRAKRPRGESCPRQMLSRTGQEPDRKIRLSSLVFPLIRSRRRGFAASCSAAARDIPISLSRWGWAGFRVCGAAASVETILSVYA